jgi:mono/diheme cytochrome c family protein
MSMVKRFVVLALVAVFVLGGFFIFSYDVIKIDWVTLMEIQASYKPLENPLPVPADSIPVEGAAYIPGMGAPVNLVPADEVSILRGEQLYSINCAQCHGVNGMGDGVIATFLQNRKPADLTDAAVQSKSDGALFLTVSVGVANAMPALNENLTVRERWDVVNYLRILGLQ